MAALKAKTLTVDVISLGCRLNLSESEHLRTLLSEAEDLVVINSCAVTGEAVRQTRQAIRRARRLRPEARLLVTGCAAEVDRNAIAAMPEVDGLIANTVKHDPRAWNVSTTPPGPITPSGHTRAFLAVQNGCDHACSFCIIPQGRGPSRSLPIPRVLQQLEQHLAVGTQEAVLTGVDLTSWGHDLPGSPTLGKLVSAILDAFPDLARLRLSSVDGIELDPMLIDLLASEARLLPYLHLSLQHGDDLILKRMKRRHRRADAVALIRRLRAARPDLAVGADLIAGFPTESHAAHAANLTIIDELAIVHGHIFPYSARPGTPAARMPQLTAPEIKRRAAELREAVSGQRQAWLESLLGTPQRVLAERDGTGHAENFARVQLPPGTVPGSIVTVTPNVISEGLLA